MSNQLESPSLCSSASSNCGSSAGSSASSDAGAIPRLEELLKELSDMQDQDTVSRLRTQGLRGLKRIGIFWPIAKIRKKFRRKPKAALIVSYAGELGIVMASKWGMEDGCTVLDIETNDQVMMKIPLLRQSAGATSLDDFFERTAKKSLPTATKSTKMARGKDAPTSVVMQFPTAVETAAAAPPAMDCDEYDEHVAKKRCFGNNLFRSLATSAAGLSLLKFATDESVDTDADIETTSTASTSVEVGKRSKKNNVVKEIIDTQRVLNEKLHLEKQMSVAAECCQLKVSSLEKLQERLADRATDDLYSLYLEGYNAQAGDDHKGYAVAQKVTAAVAQLGRYALIIAPLEKCLPTDTTSWRTSHASELLDAIREVTQQDEYIKSSLPSDDILSILIGRCLEHGLRATSVEELSPYIDLLKPSPSEPSTLCLTAMSADVQAREQTAHLIFICNRLLHRTSNEKVAASMSHVLSLATSGSWVLCSNTSGVMLVLQQLIQHTTCTFDELSHAVAVAEEKSWPLADGIRNGPFGQEILALAKSTAMTRLRECRSAELVEKLFEQRPQLTFASEVDLRLNNIAEWHEFSDELSAVRINSSSTFRANSQQLAQIIKHREDCHMEVLERFDAWFGATLKKSCAELSSLFQGNNLVSEGAAAKCSTLACLMEQMPTSGQLGLRFMCDDRDVVDFENARRGLLQRVSRLGGGGGGSAVFSM